MFEHMEHHSSLVQPAAALAPSTAIEAIGSHACWLRQDADRQATRRSDGAATAGLADCVSCTRRALEDFAALGVSEIALGLRPPSLPSSRLPERQAGNNSGALWALIVDLRHRPSAGRCLLDARAGKEVACVVLRRSRRVGRVPSHCGVHSCISLIDTQ